ncbi:MAG: Unknown protein [uncultured Sulfurovum sp.]|uniref:Uncharacterized protein n=1 Tax=uncultured Sulfurovum sp. TaxID=269237 RepID=A0A6S6ST25_9BACT|nr:MAG: Unknown protein [uncultured Sulfurovum sp.]
MRLKYNNFLIITPVFLFLGIIMAFFNFSIQKREMTWGLHEELTSTLIASSVFLKQSEHLSDTQINQAFQKILNYNRVKKIVYTDELQNVIQAGEHNFTKENKNFNKSTLLDHNISISEIYQLGHLSFINTEIKINNTYQKLTMTFDVSDFNDKFKVIHIHSIMIIFIVTLLGIFISIILSIVVANKIKDISIMAKALGSGEYNTLFNLSKIKEFSELGVTLDIMKSILQESFLKTKNTMIQKKFLSTETQKIVLYTPMNSTSNIFKSAHISLVIKTVGYHSNAFYNIIENENFIYVYFGNVNEEINKEKSTIITASLSYYLDNTIKRRQNINLDFISTFEMKSFTYAIINKSTNHIKLSSLNKPTQNREQSLDDIQKNIFYADNDIALQKRVQSYIQHYPQLSLKELSHDISLYKEKNIFMIISLEEESTLSTKK